MNPPFAVLVTGAGSGIGYATAERFVREGWFVGVADIDGPSIKRAVDTLGSDQCMGLHFDVREPTQFKRAMASFVETAGRIDVLVNNAGVVDIGLFHEIPEEKTRRMVDVNLMGVINGSYAVIPHLEKGGGGVIVNIASLSAAYGIPHIAVYAATKHAVVALSQALDLELAGQGIRVVAICPPFVETPILSSPRHGAPSPEAPKRRLQPAEVADEVWRGVQGGGVLRFPGLGSRAFFRICRAFPSVGRLLVQSGLR